MTFIDGTGMTSLDEPFGSGYMAKSGLSGIQTALSFFLF